MGVGGLRHDPAAFTPGKSRYPLYRRLGGPQGRSGLVRKFPPLPGFDPRTVQPVASRYTDWAIPAPMEGMKPSLSNILNPRVPFSILGRNIFLGTVALWMLCRCSSLHRPSYVPQFYDVKGILETGAEMQIAIMAAEWRILWTAAKSWKEVV
jgi:hypothetical protein